MKEPIEKEVRSFPCMDDSPFNNGYGYNEWHPGDDDEDDDEILIDDEDFNNDNP